MRVNIQKGSKIMQKKFFSIVLSLFVVLTSFSATQSYSVKAQDSVATTINEDGVRLTKEASKVEGSLNEWDVNLKVELDRSDTKHDIVLVIDTSGSMKEFDRINEAKKAANEFVDAVLLDKYLHINRISLITYSTGPTKITGFTNSKRELKNAIESVKPDGGTFTQAAIKDARDLLSKSNAEKKSIILLTDGAPSFGFSLSDEGLSKYASLPKQNLIPKSNNQNFTLKITSGKWEYSELNNIGVRMYDHQILRSKAEANFNETDFNYENNFGGHGARAIKRLFRDSSKNTEYFLNLYASATAEAKFAKNKGIEFYTVGLGLRNDIEALEMLRNMASGPNRYFDAEDNAGDLSDIFLSIAEELNFPLREMNFSDPMGQSIDLSSEIAMVEGSLGNVVYNDGLQTILGEMTRDNFTYNEETKKYEFHIKYRVHTNLNAVNEVEGSNTILTNGDAKFEYVTKKSSNNKTEHFPQPTVKPTILAVTKKMVDESGTENLLVEENHQRKYQYAFSKDQQETSSNFIDAFKPIEYHILSDFEEYKITETGIVHDDLNKYDVSYTFSNAEGTWSLNNQLFKLKEGSGLNTISIINTMKKDYEYNDFEFEKTVKDYNENGFAEHLEDLKYTLTLRNNKSIFLRDVFIKDDLSKILGDVDIDKAQKLVIKRGNETTDENVKLENLMDGYTTYLAPDEQLEISFVVTVKDYGTELNDKLDNEAHVLVNKGESSSSASINTKTPNIIASKLVKDSNDNSFAEPGEELQYNIRIENKSDVDHNNLWVQDTLSDLKEHINDTDNLVFTMTDKEYPLQKLQEGFTISPLEANGTIEINFSVTVREDLDTFKVSKLSNKANVDYKEIAASIETGNHSISATKNVYDSTGDGIAGPNEEINYEINVENKGNVDKSDVIVKDELSLIEDYIVKEDFDKPGTVKVESENGTKLYSSNDLKQDIEVIVKAKSSTKIMFKVKTIADLDSDKVPKLLNKAFVDDIEVQASINTGMPKISANKYVKDTNGNGIAEPGELINYSIVISNTGNVAKENILVKDAFDNLLETTNVTDQRHTEIVTVDTSGIIQTITLDQLMSGVPLTIPANSKVLISFSIRVNQEIKVSEIQNLHNIADVDDYTPDALIPTGDSLITVDKSVMDQNGDAYAEAGEILTYSINIGNVGTVKEEDLLIKDSLDELLPHIESISDSKVNVNGEERPLQDLVDGFTLDIDHGERINLTFNVKLKSDFNATETKILNNTVYAGKKMDEVSIATGMPVAQALKEVEDDNKDGFVEAGEALHYTLKIKNNGNVKKENLEVQDKLEELLPHIETISDSKVSVNGVERPLQDLVDGFTVDLEAGESIELKFTVTIKEDFDASEVESINNIASIGSETPEIKIPTGEAKIKALKEVEDDNKDGFVEAGEALHYTLKIKNNGNVKKENLEVQDKLEELLPHIETISDSKVSVNGVERPLQDLVDGFTVDLEAGESIELKFTVTIKEDLDALKTRLLKNVATVGELLIEAEIETKPTKVIDKVPVEPENPKTDPEDPKVDLEDPKTESKEPTKKNPSPVTGIESKNMYIYLFVLIASLYFLRRILQHEEK